MSTSSGLRHRFTTIVRGACLALCFAGVAASSPASAAATVAIAGPASFQLNYQTPVVATTAGGPITLVSVDVQPHNFVALEAYGADDRHWCTDLPLGKCPLFWSPLIINDVVAVEGLDQTPSGTYRFYCSIHPNRMRGTLVVV